MSKTVFVFGSNLAGRHGAGAALTAARHYGAVRGVGQGRMNACYAIPTKDRELKRVPLSYIERHVQAFITHATRHPDEKFKVTRIGCGLAGYSNEQVAPLFANAPPNCYIDPEWSEWLPQLPTFDQLEEP